MMGVKDRGLRAWLRRLPSIRQRRDMVILAHIRDQHRLSLGSYGRSRMTEELNELGLRVGHLARGTGRNRRGVLFGSRGDQRGGGNVDAANQAPGRYKSSWTWRSET